ncbi:MAG TPA: family 43 glycosylhydrolase [Catenuloplanes sp.]|jgi:arabinan endo-1,5-alpha-L-arabinosidase
MFDALRDRRPSLARRYLTMAVAAVALVAAVILGGSPPADALTGDIRVHDPSVIRVASCYYGFSTGRAGTGGGTVSIRKTCDPSMYGGWTSVGTIWNAPPAWIRTRIGSTPPNLWAPDINYFNGKFHLYYGASIWGQQHTAVMGLATATSIEGPWTDAGEVTNVNYPIDPDISWSGSTPYVLWGSWPGVYLHALDPSTGKLSTTDHSLPKIASNIEGASITFNGGYFYLFGSRGTCCRGVNSTYHTVVGRATNIKGPYLDKSGRNLADGGGTTILTGSGSQVAAGGGDVFADGSTPRFAYHFYDATANGAGTLNIRTIGFSGGWPTLSAPVSGGAGGGGTVTSLVSQHANRCLDVPNGSTTNGTQLIVWDCRNTPFQRFTHTAAGELRTTADKCLDAWARGTTPGTIVAIYDCTGGVNQKWNLNGDGTVVNRHNSLCLDLTGAGTANGTPIRLWTCTGGASQKWTRR